MAEDPKDLVPAQVILGERFTPTEAEILKGILADEDAAVELAIPVDMDPERLWAALDCACKVKRTFDKGSDRIKPIIGRMLLVIQEYPQLYQARGYRTYDDFMTKGMPELFGIGRQEAYKLVQAARAFPNMTIADFKAIGVAKLYTILPAVNENPAAKERLLDAAKSMTVEKLKEEVARARGQSPDDIRIDPVIINCSKTIKQQWVAFKGHAGVQSYVGSESDCEIFAAMISECWTEWSAQMENNG